ncbi:MAG: orotate phosphoribosyltransferase [Bacteroidetes bacterium]|nr:orotate phosphoribosyltransferase [Bacteroidota bacterium]
MITQAEVAEKLLQIKAIKLSPQNPFTWASGIQSPIYCDNRLVLSFPEVRDYIKGKLAEASAEFGDFNRVAGVATAGIAHGMLLADALDKPFAYVRSKAKAHGRQNLIEGLLEAGDKVLVVEDLISTGGSSLQAVQAIRDAGCTVVGVIAIFSYGFERADLAFKEAACPYTTLSNYGALIKKAVEMGYVEHSELDMLTDWRQTVGKK